jgi:hypothetical protein
VLVKTGVPHPLTVLVQAVTGQRDEQARCSARRAPQRARHLVAAHSRKPDVTEDNLGLECGAPDALAPVVCNLDDMPGMSQEITERLGVVAIVFDHQNATGP